MGHFNFEINAKTKRSRNALTENRNPWLRRKAYPRIRDHDSLEWHFFTVEWSDERTKRAHQRTESGFESSDREIDYQIVTIPRTNGCHES